MRLPFNGNYTLTQKFGVNKEDYVQFGLQGHDGLDFGTPVGTPVVAPIAGTVVEANFDSNGYGNYVKIQNDKEGSVLAHLKSISVAINFAVKEGDYIGDSGNTGNVFPRPNAQFPNAGAHLHWGYYTLPRNRSNGFDGFIDQLPLLNQPMDTYVYKYKIGDILEPSTDVMVYPKPEKGQAAYGKIGFNYQGKIIGMREGWYNIDQTAMGGGTGWVVAKDVDTLSAFIPRATPSTPIANTYTEEQYLSMQKERDDALSEASKAHDDLVEANKTITAFKAVGIERVDDITKLKSTYDTTINGLNKQLLEVLERNKKLSTIIKDKENEDYTAIEEGMKGIEKAKELEDHLSQIAKNVGTKPEIGQILQKIWSVFDFAKKAKKQLEQKEVQVPTPEVKPITKEDTSANWLLQFFGLVKGVK